MFESFEVDDLGRIIYRITREGGYTEEWWFEYDRRGEKILVKYIKERKPF